MTTRTTRGHSPRRFALDAGALVTAAFVAVVLTRGVVNRIGVSFGLREGSSAIALSFWPFLAATVILAPFAFSKNRPRGKARALLALKGAVSVGLCQVLFVLSQQWGSATFASIASALVPIVAALLAARSEPVTRRMMLGGSLALGGAAAFAVARSGASGGERPLAAVAAATAALLTAAWFYLHNRSSTASAPPSLMDALARVWPQFLSSTVVLGVFGLFAGASRTTLSLWWLHALIGVVGYAAPLVISVWMLPRAGVALSTYTNYASIPATAVASIFMLDAQFSLIGWVSLAVVLTGLWVSLSQRQSPTAVPLTDANTGELDAAAMVTDSIVPTSPTHVVAPGFAAPQ
jgi:drug/metabolite transporter (DMT)-like permease